MPGRLLSPTVFFPRLRALRLRHALLLGSAYWALLRAQVLVRGRATGTFVHPLGLDPRPSDRPVPERVRRIAYVIHQAARTVPIRPVCLVRAVALTSLLAQRGYPGARVRAGVRMVGGRLEAHAWVEYDGHAVAEPADQLASFEPIATVDVNAFS